MTQPATARDSKRILIIQKAGDFREAHRRRRQGLGDQYYGHSYVLDELERIGSAFGEVAIMCCTTKERYHERLSDQVLAIGAAADPKTGQSDILAMISDFRPSHLVVNGPMSFIIEWGLERRCELMCILADSFNGGLVRRLLRYRPLGRLLNRDGVSLIGNHGLNASRSLAGIGVDPAKIIPWDWPYARLPADTPVRSAPSPGSAKLLYVGTLQEDKGVGDLIEAIALLKQAGSAPHLTIVGAGSGARFQDMSTQRGLTDHVDFAGVMPNEDVIALMQQSDVVVVPSRHIYPEGFPLVLYEALSTRTPIVASDHPMFRGHLVDGRTASVFPAGKPERLAARIRELLADRALYAQLSANSGEAWDRLQNPVKWGEMIERWLRLADTDREWLSAHSLEKIGPREHRKT